MGIRVNQALIKDHSKMAKKSIKHLQIDKSQATVLGVIAVATFVTIFCLFGVKTLITKGAYQNRALKAQHQAVTDLKNNYTQAKTLVTQYKVFAAQNPNLLGGAISGNGASDGDNPRIILDSLPSKYDAPALGSSLEKILTDQNYKFTSLSITDDPTANSDAPEESPQPKTLTFSIAGTSGIAGSNKMLQAFERSIRPFDITNLQISGTDEALQITATMTTQYQPAKTLKLSATKEVK
jgi:hypothetical protein